MLADGTHLTWNLAEDVRRLFAFHFMVNAFRAGTVIAVVAGVVGWFVVLRRQTFAAHTLSLVGFPGAAGATWLGLSAAAGYFGFCIAAALLIAAVPRAPYGGYSEESAAVGTIQAFALASGFLFVTLAHSVLNGVNALLFGTFLGVTDAQVRTLLVAGVVVLTATATIGRPLFFASVDPDVAGARGVRVRLLSVAFLVTVGIAVAAASQITGSLLVFSLLVVPAASAQVLTARPVAGLLLSVVLALTITWVALAIAYYSVYPVGFWITSLAFGVYAVARASRWVAEHRGVAAVAR